MKTVGRLFESALWNSRLVVLAAVLASLAASLAMFYVATVDTVYTVIHLASYADPGLAEEARKAIREGTVTHVVEIVDGYLLAAVLLIFALGLYELFVSKIDAAEASGSQGNVLFIRDLDDLKNRLAKVILMILVVNFFEHALVIQTASALELLYLGGGIALVGLALYLTHAAEGKKGPKAADHG
jgi:uncharacterized membrane protein YqhA